MNCFGLFFVFGFFLNGELAGGWFCEHGVFGFYTLQWQLHDFVTVSNKKGSSILVEELMRLSLIVE